MNVIQTPKDVFAVLLADDPALRSALNYLFSVILKYDFEMPDSGMAARDCLVPDGRRRLLFVYANDDDPDAIKVIEYAKGLAPPPVVIALQSGTSDFGAQAFLAGVDDVVDWPCSLYELALRLFVRLGLPPKENAALISNANWETEAYISERAGLTTAEAQVMRILFAHDGNIVSRDDLSLAVDGRPWRYGDRKFDVHVAKIRKKLGDAFGGSMSVSTIRSLGYCLSTKGADMFGAGRVRARN